MDIEMNQANLNSDYNFESLVEGMQMSRSYAFTEQIYQSFLQAFGDVSPLHVSDSHAIQRGFNGRVMHGGILNGFLSHFIGMCMPGSRALLLRSQLYYLKPSYLGDIVELQAEIERCVASQKVILLKVGFFNAARKTLVARGEAEVRVGE